MKKKEPLVQFTTREVATLTKLRFTLDLVTRDPKFHDLAQPLQHVIHTSLASSAEVLL
jgi:hypothetical protein